MRQAALKCLLTLERRVPSSDVGAADEEKDVIFFTYIELRRADT